MKIILLMIFFVSTTGMASDNHANYQKGNLILFNSHSELSEEIKSQGEQVIKGRLETAWAEAVETYQRVIDENTYTHGILSENRRFKNSMRYMKKAELMWGMDIPNWKMCKGNSLAYIIQIPSLRHRVYICPKAYIQSQDVLTQIMLHEAAHMGGTTSECQASIMEVLAISFSPIQNAIKSGYWERCKLERMVNRLNQ